MSQQENATGNAEMQAMETRLRAFLDALIEAAGLHLDYELAPTPAPLRELAELPARMVAFSGADSGLLLAENAELLRSIEILAVEALRLRGGEHDPFLFDCQGHRLLRVQELNGLAEMAAERVRGSGAPYAFAPMHARDRRIVHLALKKFSGISSESEGEGAQRHIVVRSLTASSKSPASGGRKEYRRL